MLCVVKSTKKLIECSKYGVRLRAKFQQWRNTGQLTSLVYILTFGLTIALNVRHATISPYTLPALLLLCIRFREAGEPMSVLPAIDNQPFYGSRTLITVAW